ncbi:hypothetical protein D3C81_975590 [compost metagenome]
MAAGHGGQHRRHKLHRVVRLEVRCLEGQHAISSRVSAGKAVVGKADDHVVYRVRLGFTIALRLASDDEMASLLIEHLAFFLGHRPTQQIGFTQRKARHFGSDLHDLLLVHDDAVRIFQDRLKIPVRIFHTDLPMLAGDEFGDELHGTRTVQRIDGNDVLECRRLELLQHSPHARGLQLEHAGRLSAAQHLVRCRIVVRNKPEIGCAARLLLDPVHATLDNGQGAQPQKIHFKQADRFQVLHGVLR